jgi:hypothetical protein
MAGPRLVVDGPSFTPLPYGLWDAIQKPPAPGTHWQNGITWSERCGGGDTLYEECIAVTGTGGAPTAQAALTSNVVQTNRGATPFTVYAEFDCSPVGLTDAETIAASALARVEQWQVERAFWTGLAGKTVGGTAQTTVFPHLAANAVLLDSDGITLQTAASTAATGATMDVADGLGRLEGALADCYHGQGVIHMPPKALATFKAWDLVEEDGSGALFTTAGNRVVVGTGYAGTGPDGSAATAGTSWLYATGAVFGYQGPVFMPTVPESFNRVENTMRLMAQRTYVIGFECCHFATQVSLGVPL